MTPAPRTAVTACNAVTTEHRRGMSWFSSLAQAMERSLDEAEDAGVDNSMSLEHSVQLYRVFVETGDARYLDLAEDFLKYTLDLRPAR